MAVKVMIDGMCGRYWPLTGWAEGAMMTPVIFADKVGGGGCDGSSNERGVRSGLVVTGLAERHDERQAN